MTSAQKRQVIRELRQQGLSLRLALDLLQMARATFYRQGRRVNPKRMYFALRLWKAKTV